MSRRIHFRLDIKGALKNFEDEHWGRTMKTDDGKWFTPAEVRDYFIECLSEGILYLPMGDCDKFDPKNGCPGHEE